MSIDGEITIEIPQFPHRLRNSFLWSKDSTEKSLVSHKKYQTFCNLYQIQCRVVIRQLPIFMEWIESGLLYAWNLNIRIDVCIIINTVDTETEQTVEILMISVQIGMGIQIFCGDFLPELIDL